MGNLSADSTSDSGYRANPRTLGPPTRGIFVQKTSGIKRRRSRRTSEAAGEAEGSFHPCGETGAGWGERAVGLGTLENGLERGDWPEPRESSRESAASGSTRTSNASPPAREAGPQRPRESSLARLDRFQGHVPVSRTDEVLTGVFASAIRKERGILAGPTGSLSAPLPKCVEGHRRCPPRAEVRPRRSMTEGCGPPRRLLRGRHPCWRS